MNILNKLKEKGFLKDEKFYNAFSKIKRKDFISRDLKNYADEDVPLPIGHEQTISQPSVVAFMIEKLNPSEGEKILDIGCGSGWTTALLSEVVGKKGKVIGVEIIPEVKYFGEENISKYNFIKEGRVLILRKNGYEGVFEESPFDNILISAALSNKEELSPHWKNQLKEGGSLVVPIADSIYKLTKKEGKFEEEEYFGFNFVPFVKDEK